VWYYTYDGEDLRYEERYDGYAKGGMVDENKAHYYQSEGTIWVDSNFVNFSKGNIPNSELKHYGYGDFYLDTPKGKISFYRVDKNIDGFVGRSHKLKASDELGSELLDAMGDKVQEIRAYAEGGMVDYFENYEQLPENVQELYFSWGKRLESGAEYEDLKQMLSEFEANGYTFDYGLDAEPYDLRPIGEYGEGGGLMSKEIDDDTWNRLKRESEGGIIEFSDGYKFREVNKQYAIDNWNTEDIYAINIDDESERVIYNENDISDYDTFGVEV